MIVAKEQLLRDVSHELRSPLTRIAVASDLVTDEKLRGSLKEDVRKIDRLVSEILESYRLRDGSVPLKKSPTDLAELVRGIAADYSERSQGVTRRSHHSNQLRARHRGY